MNARPSSSRLSLRRKRSSRIAAVQALYNREITGTTLSPEKQVNQLMQQWKDSISAKDPEWPSHDLPETSLLLDIVQGAVAQHAAIDEVIAPYIKKEWKKERMDPTMVAILHAATYELHYKPARSTAIIVDEYVTIGSDFLDDDALGFANSVLQRIAQARPAAPAA